MNHKETVLATSEEEIVIIADLHAFNWLAMSLYLIDLSELRHLEDVDGTGFAFLTNTSNECLLVGSKHDLRELNASIKPVLVVLAVPDLAVIAHSIHLERLARDVHDRCEVDVLLVKVFVVKSLLVLLLHDQVVEVNVTVDTARSETCVVLEPVDASDFVHVTLTLVVLGAVLGVEVVYPYCVVSDCTGKQVASMRELDFSAGLNL